MATCDSADRLGFGEMLLMFSPLVLFAYIQPKLLHLCLAASLGRWLIDRLVLWLDRLFDPDRNSELCDWQEAYAFGWLWSLGMYLLTHRQ